MGKGLRITELMILVMCVFTLCACKSRQTDIQDNTAVTDNPQSGQQESRENGDSMSSDKEVFSSYTKETKVIDVINDSVFSDYGRLIFPVDINIDNNLELENISSVLPWYSEVNIDKTVEIVNYLKNEAQSRQIFYDI